MHAANGYGYGLWSLAIINSAVSRREPVSRCHRGFLRARGRTALAIRAALRWRRQLRLRPNRRHRRSLIAGKAAGFQDALFGFGLRYAILSGHLAGRADGSDHVYEQSWRPRVERIECRQSRQSLAVCKARGSRPAIRARSRCCRTRPAPQAPAHLHTGALEERSRVGYQASHCWRLRMQSPVVIAPGAAAMGRRAEPLRSPDERVR